MAHKKPKIVRKPFMKGTVLDQKTLGRALRHLCYLLVLVVFYLLTSTIMSRGSLIVRLLINGAILLVLLYIFYGNGAGTGAGDVELGEKCLIRQQAGHVIDPGEKKRCYHPLKGLLAGLLGSLPFFIAAVALALTAKQLLVTMGTLPDWARAYTTRGDIAGGLAQYNVTSSADITDVLRVIVRMQLMPYVSIVSSDNSAGLLMLERISPLLVLLPAFAYGIGYTRGVALRTQVHSNIARNNRRRAKAEKRRVEARRSVPKKNELN